jgi:hypothetical protein
VSAKQKERKQIARGEAFFLSPSLPSLPHLQLTRAPPHQSNLLFPFCCLLLLLLLRILQLDFEAVFMKPTLSSKDGTQKQAGVVVVRPKQALVELDNNIVEKVCVRVRVFAHTPSRALFHRALTCICNFTEVA